METLTLEIQEEKQEEDPFNAVLMGRWFHDNGKSILKTNRDFKFDRRQVKNKIKRKLILERKKKKVRMSVKKNPYIYR